jgi:hypothetical protein
MSKTLILKGLVRPFKPWVVPAGNWKTQFSNPDDFFQKFCHQLGLSVAVAKPSENLYLGPSDGIGAILNLASHGEMAISKLLIPDKHLDPRLARLVNILPSFVEVNGEKIGTKNGKFLNHFGYRKQVMNLVPESLEDHAWIACALSYNISIPDELPDKWMFDPRGGWIGNGVAATTREGGIFRGSAVSDSVGEIASANESLNVSLEANAQTVDDIVDIATCSPSDFVGHKFYSKLASIVGG